MRHAMTKSRIAFGVWLLIWALLFACGISLLSGVTAQKVPGYPNQGQIIWYVLFPCSLALANALIAIFCSPLAFAISCDCVRDPVAGAAPLSYFVPVAGCEGAKG